MMLEQLIRGAREQGGSLIVDGITTKSGVAVLSVVPVDVRDSDDRLVDIHRYRVIGDALHPLSDPTEEQSDD